MKRFRLILAIVSALALGACGKANTTCSDEDAKAALEIAIRDSLQKIVLANAKGSDGKLAVGGSKVRAAIADLKLVIENIRTTKEDPNSTKRFCTGNLKIVFGTNVFDDAAKAREIAGLPGLDDAADAAGVDKGADYLTGDLDYSVQPTDDGIKIVAEFEDADAKLGVFGEVLAASLLRSNLENRQRMEAENAALAAKQEEEAINAANRASIEQATLARKTADEALTAVWQGLSPEVRQQLLAEQRVWIKRKDASCKVHGLQSATDPTGQAVATLNCQANEAQNRMGQLQNYLSAY